MAIEKEETARKAAARFSTDPHLATILFSRPMPLQGGRTIFIVTFSPRFID
ncbi:MAG: hypothetical protein OEM61_02325 [Desulfobacteraceae bacterium]|nr:hypothetical protein [Desulfobacteraceae bacterium]MDH3566172.1 hypothetical protein [Desulfobacteraceae bacterium]